MTCNNHTFKVCHGLYVTLDKVNSAINCPQTEACVASIESEDVQYFTPKKATSIVQSTFHIEIHIVSVQREDIQYFTIKVTLFGLTLLKYQSQFVNLITKTKFHTRLFNMHRGIYFCDF